MRRMARGNVRGLTFYEVMVTVAILSFGFVLIYKAFIAALDNQHHLSCRLHADYILRDNISLIQNYYLKVGEFPSVFQSRQETRLIDRKNVRFEFTAVYVPVRNINGMYQVNMTIAWREGSRKLSLTRPALITRFGMDSAS